MGRGAAILCSQIDFLRPIIKMIHSDGTRSPAIDFPSHISPVTMPIRH